jgi:hypothetical protein
MDRITNVRSAHEVQCELCEAGTNRKNLKTEDKEVYDRPSRLPSAVAEEFVGEPEPEPVCLCLPAFEYHFFEVDTLNKL